MASPNLNKVLLIGRLTKDPDLRYIPTGTPVTTFRLAINRVWGTKEDRKEETCYVNVVAWGKQAEICAEYLKKGHSVFVEGRLTYREWETENKEKRNTIEVKMDNFQFMERAVSTDDSKNIPAADTEAVPETRPDKGE